MSTMPLQRILFVDDELDIRVVTQVALEQVGGFTVVLCESGADAVERAAAFAPDLVILDVMMPGMDGPSTLEALRQIPGLAETPVVFLTAKTQAHEIAEFKALGAIDVITKPFDPMLLAAHLRVIWEREFGAGAGMVAGAGEE